MTIFKKLTWEYSMDAQPWKRTPAAALILSVVLGAAVWILDALFDHLFFYKGYSSFFGLLFTDIPSHEIYIRTSALMLFILFGTLSAVCLKRFQETETKMLNIFNNVIPICITDTDYNIISANKSYQEIFGPVQQDGRPIKCHDSRPGPKCKTEECPLRKITGEGHAIFTCESTKKEKDGTLRYFIVTATSYLDTDNTVLGIIETFQDITPRRLLEKEREKLIGKLQMARNKVKTLSGFLPICASCKKIRDDKGYWNQIESYIREHSEAEFSHSICPSCAKKLYGKYVKNKEEGKGG